MSRPSVLKRWKCSMRELFERVTHGPWTTSGLDVQYRLERDSDKLTLLFQCTSSKGDWYYNFLFFKTLYKDMAIPMYVHTGFAKLWHSVRDEIMDKLKAEAVLGAIHLTIVGYSQGAALATLAHEDVGFQLPGLTCVTIGFGAPRVIWMPSKAIKTRFASYTRATVRGDIVTMLPPPFYGHIGKEALYGTPHLPSAERHRPGEYRLYL